MVAYEIQNRNAINTNTHVNTNTTRSTQRAQTSAEHGMTQNPFAIFFSNPEDPDFGLWTPGSKV